MKKPATETLPSSVWMTGTCLTTKTSCSVLRPNGTRRIRRRGPAFHLLWVFSNKEFDLTFNTTVALLCKAEIN
jgi:hypothetical protein